MCSIEAFRCISWTLEDAMRRTIGEERRESTEETGRCLHLTIERRFSFELHSIAYEQWAL